MKRSLNRTKGAVTVEACIAFPIFLCFFLTLIFFIRLACIDIVIQHTANETVKQLAAAAYPIKYINELEDEIFLDNGNYEIPSFTDELLKAKEYIVGSIEGDTTDIFSMLITGGENKEEKSSSLSEVFESISDRALNGLKTGIRAYITDKFGADYYELKNRVKYTAARIISEKHIEGSYLDENKLEYTLVQIPQSIVEYNIRGRDDAYVSACKLIGYYPEKDDVVVALSYKVKIPIPFFNDREINLKHIGVERAWLKGSNGVYSQDFGYQAENGSGDSESEDESIEENYRKQLEQTVYVTNTGKKYHKSDCPCLSYSRRPIKLSDAEDKGYKKCGVCSNKGKWNFYK